MVGITVLSNRTHEIRMSKLKNLANQNKPHTAGPTHLDKTTTRVSYLQLFKQWTSLLIVMLITVAAVYTFIASISNVLL